MKVLTEICWAPPVNKPQTYKPLQPRQEKKVESHWKGCSWPSRTLLTEMTRRNFSQPSLGLIRALLNEKIPTQAGGEKKSYQTKVVLGIDVMQTPGGCRWELPRKRFRCSPGQRKETFTFIIRTRLSVQPELPQFVKPTWNKTESRGRWDMVSVNYHTPAEPEKPPHVSILICGAVRGLSTASCSKP